MASSGSGNLYVSTTSHTIMASQYRSATYPATTPAPGSAFAARAMRSLRLPTRSTSAALARVLVTAHRIDELDEQLVQRDRAIVTCGDERAEPGSELAGDDVLADEVHSSCGEFRGLLSQPVPQAHLTPTLPVTT